MHLIGQPLVLPGELKDVVESPAELFPNQLVSVDPPPMCQPRSYAAVAASNITISKQLQEATYVYVRHSWAQRKLSPLNPLNILLSINGPLLSLGFNRLTINRSNLQKLTINAFNGLKKFND